MTDAPQVFVSGSDLRIALEMIAETIEDRSPRESRALLRLWEAIEPAENAAYMAGWGWSEYNDWDDE